MEKIAILFTILFVLSMISERFTEWMKNFLSCKKIPGTKTLIIGDTLTKFPEGSKEETRRSFRVLKLSLFSGFVTAISCHASLFAIITDPDNPQLGWDNATASSGNWEWPGFIVGCLFTGAFISLGSKFWHDMLDMILAVKNVKRTLANELNKNELDSKFPAQQEALLKGAIVENIQTWRNTIKNFQGVTITNKLIGTPTFDTGTLCLQFNVSKKEIMPGNVQSSVPSTIYYGGVSIPTDVKETGVIEAAAKFTGQDVTPRPGGSSIARNDEKDNTGTLGIRVKMNDGWYAFSCYHVLFPEENKERIHLIEKNQNSRIKGATSVFSPSALDDDRRLNLGNVGFGQLSNFVDIGFFKTDEDAVSQNVNGLKIKHAIHDFSLQERNKLKVKFCGRTSGVITEGTVTGVAAKDITHFRNTPYVFTQPMENLLELKIEAAHGDSGALVLTEDGSILGVMTAVGTGVAYVVAMRAILNNYSFDFK